jgi:hypothetical protein
MRVGDVLISVNEREVSTPQEVEFSPDGKRIGDRVILEVFRNDISYYFTETLAPSYSSTYMVIVFVVGCLFFSLGVFVYFQRPFDKGARVFHLSFRETNSPAPDSTLSTTLLLLMTEESRSAANPVKDVHLPYIFLNTATINRP